MKNENTTTQTGKDKTMKTTSQFRYHVYGAAGRIGSVSFDAPRRFAVVVSDGSDVGIFRCTAGWEAALIALDYAQGQYPSAVITSLEAA